jgi:hypothetical protein
MPPSQPETFPQKILSSPKPSNSIKPNQIEWRSSSPQFARIEIDQSPGIPGLSPLTRNPFIKTILPVTHLNRIFYEEMAG